MASRRHSDRRGRYLDYEGVQHRRFRIRYTLVDGHTRQVVLYTPGEPWMRETIDRFFAARDIAILPGSNVIVTWL